jgi:hypothetical protein
MYQSRQAPTSGCPCRDVFRSMFIGVSRQSRHNSEERERAPVLERHTGFRSTPVLSLTPPQKMSGLSGLSGPGPNRHGFTGLRVPTCKDGLLAPPEMSGQRPSLMHWPNKINEREHWRRLTELGFAVIQGMATLSIDIS